MLEPFTYATYVNSWWWEEKFDQGKRQGSDSSPSPSTFLHPSFPSCSVEILNFGSLGTTSSHQILNLVSQRVLRPLKGAKRFTTRGGNTTLGSTPADHLLE